MLETFQKTCAICVITLLILSKVETTTKLRELFSWKALDYAYPSYDDKVRALFSGEFIPENNLPVGIEIWRDKLFVTVPRWKEGIPATLNYIPLNRHIGGSPQLNPYPNWEMNEARNCENGLTTAYRIKADECDRLWVLDTGTFGIGNTTTNPCPYTLNVFNLHSSKRIRKYVLRPEDINQNTFIANIAIDIGETCDDTFAYMSDELGYGLIVYSWKANRSWRFTHSYFMPDPLAGDFNIGGLNFQWGEEGIFGMSLTPQLVDGSKLLFFSPLASNKEFAVSTEILRNSSQVEGSYHSFLVVGDRGKDSHVTARVMDHTGLQFFNLIDRNAIGCWHSALPYSDQFLDVVDYDNETLIFPSDVKVDGNRNLWVMSDRMPNFCFQIWIIPISILEYFSLRFQS